MGVDKSRYNIFVAAINNLFGITITTYSHNHPSNDGNTPLIETGIDDIENLRIF
jgi:hypothetical protein